jgi:DNA-binding MarR family transcriptional regulator
MINTDEQKSSNYTLDSKWDDIIIGVGGGWTAVPNLLLKKQGVLKLGSSELNVLLNLIRFWWEPTRAPFPSPEKIAAEMGVTARTVYRTLAALEKKGFIDRVSEDGKATKYELQGLVDKLKEVKTAT